MGVNVTVVVGRRLVVTGKCFYTRELACGARSHGVPRTVTHLRQPEPQLALRGVRVQDSRHAGCALRAKQRAY